MSATKCDEASKKADTVRGQCLSYWLVVLMSRDSLIVGWYYVEVGGLSWGVIVIDSGKGYG